MPRAFNYERAAAALVDATLMGDSGAAEKYEVSVKSLQGWRKRLSEDEVLRQFFQEKKAAQDKAWADEIPSAIASCVQFLKAAAQDCKTSDPDSVHAIAGALKILGSVSMTREMVDARLSGGD